MNASCPICLDLFDDCNIIATPCGHVFHYKCIVKWMEKSRDCPECRNEITRNNIIKLFFNTTHSSCLQNDIDSKNAELKAKDSELATVRKKMKDLREHTELLSQTMYQKYLATQSELESYKLLQLKKIEKLTSEITDLNKVKLSLESQLKEAQESASNNKELFLHELKRNTAALLKLKDCKSLLRKKVKQIKDIVKENLSLKSHLKEVQENASTIEQRYHTMSKEYLATQSELESYKLQLKNNWKVK